MTTDISDIIKTISQKSSQQQRRVVGVNRNQLALWIGRLVISFNDLEKKLASALAIEISDTDNELGDMIAGSMGFDQKLDLFTALLMQRHQNSPHQIDVVQKIYRAVSSANDFRNSVVHSAWSEPTFLSVDFSRRKPTTKGGKGLRVAEERANIARLRIAVKDMWILRHFRLFVRQQ